MESKKFKAVVDTVRGMYAPKTEATMMKDTGEVVHNCAKHVEHATWGKGNCIAEEHADPDRYGNIAWYDVEFPHGVERGVPVTELNVLAAESHGHSSKKAKKMAEALSGDNSRNTENDKEKERALEAARADANKTEPNQATPGQVAGAKVGGEKEIVKQGVKEEEDLSMKVKGKAVTDAEDEDEEDEDEAKCEGILKPELEKGFPARGVKTGASAPKGTTYMPKKTVKEEAEQEVDETIVYKTIGYAINEADTNYDAHFKAHMKKAGIKHPGELKTDAEKKAFFNKVDASFKAKNEDVFLEALMSADVRDRMASHEKAGHKVSDQASRMKNGEMEYSFVVTQPSGKRSRHIYHGSKVKHETMSPAPKSKEASEIGDDEDDK